MGVKRPCLMCRVLQDHGSRCRPCTLEQSRQRDRLRGSSSERGYNSEYRRNRAAVLAMGGTCHWCGAPATTADHVQALSLGGGNEVTNLVPLCRVQPVAWREARERVATGISPVGSKCGPYGHLKVVSPGRSSA